MPSAEPGPVDPAAAALVSALSREGLTLGCAESLTGGLLAATIVSVPGASQVLRGGVVAYAAEVKESLLGVDGGLLAAHGTVYPDVALQMAAGARRLLGCDLAIATTGVAGPGPSEGHPAGTVHVACVSASMQEVRSLHLDGDRPEIRRQTVAEAVDLAASVASSDEAGTVVPTPSPRATEREGVEP